MRAHDLVMQSRARTIPTQRVIRLVDAVGFLFLIHRHGAPHCDRRTVNLYQLGAQQILHPGFQRGELADGTRRPTGQTTTTERDKPIHTLLNQVRP